MRTWAVIALIIVLILAGALIYALMGPDETTPTPTPGGNSTTTPGSNATTTTPVTNSKIRVTSPLANAVVTSPLTVTGEARGNWYFEASFPVKLLDANGKELAAVPAQAQGDWMTTNFVPFKATLTFAPPTTSTGTLVLEKDNPSGLPENAEEIRIPVRFGTTDENTKSVSLYFYNQNKDKDASGSVMCSSQGLVAVTRTVPVTNTPIQDAIRELLKGPTAAEKVLAPNSEFPLAGVSLTSASLSSGVLTLTFADPQNKTGGGSCRVSILRAQIEATAKQFPGVTSVRYAPSSVFQP